MLFEEKTKNLNPGELKTLKKLITDFGLGVFVHTHFITIENSNIVELRINNRKHMGSYSVKRKKNLDISTSFFELISGFKHLRRLTICGCDLNSIPQNISKLSRLFSLDISDNKFTDLSLVFRSLAPLPNLEQLLLRSNNICSIPENISKLQSLKILYLENNNIKELPSTFGDLIKLENLVLQNNGLTHIPEAVFSLKNLSHLGVMGNKLTDVSKNIRNLKKLLFLDIDENVILNDEVMYFLLLKFAKKGFAHVYPDEPWDHLVFTPFKSHHKNPERFKEFISNFIPHVKGLDLATQKVGIIFLSAIILSSSVTRDLFWDEVYDKSPFSSLWEEIFFTRARFYREIEAIYDDRQVLPPIDAKYFSSKLNSIKEKEFHKTLETLKEIEKKWCYWHHERCEQRFYIHIIEIYEEVVIATLLRSIGKFEGKYDDSITTLVNNITDQKYNKYRWKRFVKAVDKMEFQVRNPDKKGLPAAFWSLGIENDEFLRNLGPCNICHSEFGADYSLSLAQFQICDHCHQTLCCGYIEYEKDIQKGENKLMCYKCLKKKCSDALIRIDIDPVYLSEYHSFDEFFKSLAPVLSHQEFIFNLSSLEISDLLEMNISILNNEKTSRLFIMYNENHEDFYIGLPYELQVRLNIKKRLNIWRYRRQV